MRPFMERSAFGVAGVAHAVTTTEEATVTGMVVTAAGMAAARTAVGLADRTTARGAAAVGMGDMAIEAVLALDGLIGVAEIETSKAKTKTAL
jgi:hypothetical protein